MDRHYLLNHYQRELQYLIREGNRFAKRYPKIASRLELDSDGSRDPHVERLIESFAFLAGRLQHTIDDEYSSVSSALQEVIYPQFRSPIPSMAIAQFCVDAERANEADGFTLAKNTTLYSDVDGIECQFQTCYPVTLWPIEINNISLDTIEKYDYLNLNQNALAALRISLNFPSTPFSELNMQSLRFFINADLVLASELYLSLFYHAVQCALIGDDPAKAVLLNANNTIKPVGFEPDEKVLPCPNHAYQGFNLITEFFQTRHKFAFFDVCQLDHIKTETKLDIVFLLNYRPKRLQLTSDCIALGCTPAINLFEKTTDPVPYRHTQSEFLLTPDKHNEQSNEIHTIQELYGITSDNKTIPIAPLYSASHMQDRSEQHTYWLAKRDYSTAEDIPGTECFVSFLSINNEELHPNFESFYAKALCTNRHVAQRMPENAPFFIDQDVPVTQIRSIRRPTLQTQPPLKGQQQWQFISALSFHHLNLLNNPEGVEILRDILRTVSFSEEDSTLRTILAIRKIETKPLVRRMTLDDAWKGFIKGVQITLIFDRAYLEGKNPFVFGAVLNRFFAQLVPINVFSEVIIKETIAEGIYKQWTPRAGNQVII